MILRRASRADAADMLAWRNDPTTRAMSRNSEAITEGEHIVWLETALADPHCVLFIAEEGSDKLGMVRVDRGEVSINVSPAFRGNGYGKRLLSMAVARFGMLQAHVRSENTASRRLFEGAGFMLMGEEDGFICYRRAL